MFEMGWSASIAQQFSRVLERCECPLGTLRRAEREAFPRSAARSSRSWLGVKIKSHTRETRLARKSRSLLFAMENKKGPQKPESLILKN